MADRRWMRWRESSMDRIYRMIVAKDDGSHPDKVSHAQYELLRRRGGNWRIVTPA